MSFAGIIRESLVPFSGTTKAVLVELLINCNHKDDPNYLFNNKLFPLKRGQYVTSLPKLSISTGLTIQQIRTAINNLVNLRVVTDSSTGVITNRARLLAVVNIDLFLVRQSLVTDMLTDQQQTNNRPATANNKDNNDNKNNKDKKDTIPEEESISPPKVNPQSKSAEEHFEEFWKLYPTNGRDKGAKKPALKSYIKALAEITPEGLLDSIQRYGKHIEATNEWNANVATWLNQKRWENEYKITNLKGSKNDTKHEIERLAREYDAEKSQETIDVTPRQNLLAAKTVHPERFGNLS